MERNTHSLTPFPGMWPTACRRAAPSASRGSATDSITQKPTGGKEVFPAPRLFVETTCFLQSKIRVRENTANVPKPLRLSPGEKFSVFLGGATPSRERENISIVFASMRLSAHFSPPSPFGEKLRKNPYFPLPCLLYLCLKCKYSLSPNPFKFTFNCLQGHFLPRLSIPGICSPLSPETALNRRMSAFPEPLPDQDDFLHG